MIDAKGEAPAIRSGLEVIVHAAYNQISIIIRRFLLPGASDKSKK
jgi:hypothetical protein